MQDFDTYNRFQASFRSSKAEARASAGEVPKKGDESDTPTLDHGSRLGLHRTLASVQRVVFADHVTTLDEAKARLQAIVDVAGAEDDAPKKAKK